VRGLVMVVMAIDHARDMLGAARFNPTDLTQTTPALFFTRWNHSPVRACLHFSRRRRRVPLPQAAR